MLLEPTPTRTLLLLLSSFLLNSAGAFDGAASGSDDHVDVSPPCPFHLSVPIPLHREFHNGYVLDLVGELVYPPLAHWRITWQQGGKIVESHMGCPCDIQVPCLLKCCHLDGTSPGHCTHRDPVCPDSLSDINSSSGLLRVLGMGLGKFVLFNGSRTTVVHLLQWPYESHVFLSRDAKGLGENFTPDRLNDGGVGFCVKPNNNEGLSPWFCKEYTKFTKVQHSEDLKYHPYGRLLAVVALFSALCVYAAFPQLRNFHGKVVVSHLVSLLLGNIVLSAVLFQWRAIESGSCPFFGIVIQYFFISSFCWLNVMCIDIFISFRTLGPVHNKKHSNRSKRFFISSLYAWGFPAVISAVTASMEWIPDLPDTIIRPSFENMCWFKEKKGAILYFFGPVGVSLAANLLLFVTTSVKIFKLKREMRKWKSRKSVMLVRKIERTKERFNLYLKLSLMMGVGRLIGFLFWILDHPKRLFVVTDIAEALQGVLIFITYVWKDEVITLFKSKFSSGSQQTTQQDTTDEMG